MKSYSVFTKKNQQEEIIEAIFVKDGFSWRACIFTGLWFLYHRMGKEFLALLVANLFLNLGEKFFFGFSAAAMQFMLAVVIGFNAEFWLSQHLLKKGYKLTSIAFGENEEEAKLQFFCDAKFEFNSSALLASSCPFSLKNLRDFFLLKFRRS